MITNRGKSNRICVFDGGHIIISKPVIIYLGVMMEAKSEARCPYEKRGINLLRRMQNTERQ